MVTQAIVHHYGRDEFLRRLAHPFWFQSFGAVSIVKVNASWFHLRERGTFGGIFGILISLGLYFAYDVGKRITETFSIEWLFYIPALMLVAFFILSYALTLSQPAGGDTHSKSHVYQMPPPAGIIRSSCGERIIGVLQQVFFFRADGALCQTFEERRDLALRQGAHEAVRGLAVDKRDHRRDRLDAHLAGDRRMVVDVHLDEFHLALGGLHDLLEDRRELLARTAPGRPEVDQHRLALRLLDDVLHEALGGRLLDEIAHRRRRGRFPAILKHRHAFQTLERRPGKAAPHRSLFPDYMARNRHNCNRSGSPRLRASVRRFCRCTGQRNDAGFVAGCPEELQEVIPADRGGHGVDQRMRVDGFM